jgi:hypothetical protein
LGMMTPRELPIRRTVSFMACVISGYNNSLQTLGGQFLDPIKASMLVTTLTPVPLATAGPQLLDFSSPDAVRTLEVVNDGARGDFAFFSGPVRFPADAALMRRPCNLSTCGTLACSFRASGPCRGNCRTRSCPRFHSPCPPGTGLSSTAKTERWFSGLFRPASTSIAMIPAASLAAP